MSMSVSEKQLTDFYKQIVEGLADAVLLLDEELHLKYTNPAGEMLFELSSKRLKGMNIDELFPGDSKLVNAVRNAQLSGNPFTERSIRVNLANMRSCVADCVVTSLRESPGQKAPVLIELTAIDRSRRISRDENQYMQSNALRSLVRGLAHEIKNPLSGLRGAAQLLDRELHSAELKEFTSIIIEEADRLRALVNRLLGPSSLPQKTRINVHEVTERVRSLAISDERAEDKKLKIVTDYDPSIPELTADRDQLIQALLNIVGNAIEAANTGGTIRITTRTIRQFTIAHKRHKLVCRIDIRDDGPGIAPELQETIFLPMVTNRAEGSGLGLSIAQSLIQQHQGMIQCESEPGNTVFRVYLPLNSKDSIN